MAESLGAVLSPSNVIEEGVNISKADCFTVQHFSYECSRRRNSAGIPYGQTLPSYLDVIINSDAKNKGKVLFNRIKNSTTDAFSFIFNTTFLTDGSLASYGDVIVAFGYIVDVEESFVRASEKSQEQGEGQDQAPVVQMLIHARILLSKMVFKGAGTSKTLTITND